MVLVNPYFSFWQKRQENVSSEEKKVLLGYSLETIKKTKNWDFSKGVSPRIWSKNSKFSIFFF